MFGNYWSSTVPPECEYGKPESIRHHSLLHPIPAHAPSPPILQINPATKLRRRRRVSFLIVELELQVELSIILRHVHIGYFIWVYRPSPFPNGSLIGKGKGNRFSIIAAMNLPSLDMVVSEMRQKKVDCVYIMRRLK